MKPSWEGRGDIVSMSSGARGLCSSAEQQIESHVGGPADTMRDMVFGGLQIDPR